VSPQERTCFRGGHGEIGLGHLQDRAGEPCESLSTSLARSNNTTFARLADRRLTSGALAATANRFLFGQALPFELGAEPSRIDEGASRLDRARTAAGLQGSTLSPLHGALIAAAIGNGGVLMRPWIAESWEGGGPRTPEVLTTALTPGQAADLAGMMAETVPYGTGRRAFARRAPALATVTVAAKTGSLSGRDPRVYRHYTWFVGFAPVHRPEVAFAVLAVNGLAWRARAPDIAREALTRWFEGESVPLEIAQAAPSPKARPAIKAKRAGHRKAAVHRRIRHRGDHGSPRSRPARSGRLHGVGAPSA
jgi:cell division protein FtsI/penicillin-binding protein 2